MSASNNPFIAITISRDLDKHKMKRLYLMQAYTDAIQKAGGIPILIPPVFPPESVQALASKIQGILLSGGGDMDPLLYRSDDDTVSHNIHRDRDDVEISLIKTSLEFKIPLLGICRGFQVMNVAMGGTLYTDIPSQKIGALRHNYDIQNRCDLVHSVQIEKSSRLAKITGVDVVETNSMHHQGVFSIAPDFIPNATTNDGLIEAAVLEKHPFFIGVQWHPEWMFASDPMRLLFNSFIGAANNYAG